MRSRDRNSRTLKRMQKRALNIQVVDPKFDAGNGASLHQFNQRLGKLGSYLLEYNRVLPQLIALDVAIKTEERVVGDLGDRLLSAIGGRFGKDSAEYAQAGGTRKSDRRRRSRKSTPVAAPAPVAVSHG